MWPWAKKGHDRRRIRSLDNVDPLELIRQEKLSRQLHTPLAQGRKNPSSTRIMEQFLVMGCSNLKTADNNPSVLFKYPESTEHELQALEEFCFPTGIPAESKDSITVTTAQGRTPSSVLVHHEKNAQNSFVFILTSDIKEIFYAICVVDDCLKNWPTFIPLLGDASQIRPNYNRTRCYMIISRWPFFSFFFDVLYSILGAEEANQSFQNNLAEQVQQNMVLRIMETVMSTPTPMPGETITLPFTNIAPFTRVGADMDEEEEMLTELNVPLLFYALELDQILTLMSAVLLEKKILFISSNTRLVTGCLEAFIPLLRPYILQCVIIPIVPDRLTQILQAPVPFIVGMANVSWARAELPQLSRSEIIMVDLDARRIHMPRDLLVPPLPGNKALHKALETPYKHLTKSFHSVVPYRPTSEQRTSAANLVHLLEEHFFGPMFKRFKHHCVTNLTDNVTVFLKESYLAEETTADTTDWFEAFLDTQIFQIFSDKRLREIDNFKPRQKTSGSTTKPAPPAVDVIELPQRVKDAVEGDDESKRGDIAWDETSLLKPEDLGADSDEPSRKRGSSVANGITPRSQQQQRTGSATPRLLVDRGRSVSSSSFLNKANKVPASSESSGDTPTDPSETSPPSQVPFSPVRKPIIPAALRSSSESSKAAQQTQAQTEATTPSS